MKHVPHRRWLCALALLAFACSESTERVSVGGDADAVHAPPVSSTPDGGLDAWTPAPLEPITTCEAAEHALRGAPCDRWDICVYYDPCPFVERRCVGGVLGPRVQGLTCTDSGPRPEPCSCDSDGVECTTEVCTDSLECLRVPDDMRCTEDTYCDPLLGCVPRPAS